MIVIFAEKPDMGRNIAAGLAGKAVTKGDGCLKLKYKGEDIAVTWGFGHLFSLYDAKDYDETYRKWDVDVYPFFPTEYKIKPDAEKRAQIKVVKDLFRAADLIINCGDADREGELIFAFAYQYSGSKKPVKRMWLQSTTPSAIKEAYDNLKDGSEMKNLEMAARTRNAMDWMIGINSTIFVTKRFPDAFGQLISIGRVQTPTLAILVNRELAIRDFKSKPFYNVEGDFGKYTGLYEVERMEDKSKAEAVIKAVSGKQGVVTDIVSKEETKSVPLLYDLSALQMDANDKLGFTAQRTLDTTQSLYEKQYVTYPRTTSRYLPEDMKGKITNVLDSLETTSEYSGYLAGHKRCGFTKAHFNDAEVESHYAIVPTGKIPSGLSPDESKLYDLIVKSLIRIVYPAAKVEKTTVVTTADGSDGKQYRFKSSGTVILEPGWFAVDAMPKLSETLPPLSKGDAFEGKYTLKEGKTEPPKRFNDKSIINAMKNAGKDIEDEEAARLVKDSGLGTPATRASILETLIRRGYVTRDKKKLIPTEMGIKLIQWLPIKDLTTPEMTGSMELRLHNIEIGKDNAKDVMKAAEDAVKEWCAQLKALPIPGGAPRTGFSGKPSGNVLGKCPKCGKDIIFTPKGASCTGYRDDPKCTYVIWRGICGKTLTDTQIKTLFSGKKLPVKGLKSKAGNVFDASLKLKDDGSIEMIFGDKPAAGGRKSKKNG